MAIKTLFDENEEESNPNKSTSLESGVIGGDGPVVAPGTAAKSTGWTNLQQYLDTNKGAGNAIADAQLGGLNKEIGATKDSINSWATEASKNVNVGIKKDTWSDKVKGASAEQINQNFGGQNAQAFDAWKNLNNYMGPQDATSDTGYKDAYNKSQNTWGKIDNANSLEGQKQLAKDVFGKDAAGNTKNYTGGMSALDSFVARGDAQGKFDAFQTGNANFNDTLKNKVSGIDASIANAEAQGEANYKTVMDSIAARIAGFNSEQKDRVTAENDRVAAEAEKAGKLTFGLNKDFQHDVTVDPYITKASGLDMATDAEIAALNMLGGMDNDDTTGGYAKGTGAAKFDMAGYQKAVEDKFAKWSESRPAPPPAPPPTVGGEDLVSQILRKAVAPPASTYNGVPADPVQNEDGSIDWYDKNGNKIN
jgi:hypothetical protein